MQLMHMHESFVNYVSLIYKNADARYIVGLRFLSAAYTASYDRDVEKKGIVSIGLFQFTYLRFTFIFISLNKLTLYSVI